MDSLANTDLNTVFLKLRESGSKIFGSCREIFHHNPLKNEAYLLLQEARYIPKTSMSLSDVILSQARKDPEGQIFNIALKIWYDWKSIPIVERQKKLQEIYQSVGSNDQAFLTLFDIGAKNERDAETKREYLMDDIPDNAKSVSLEYEAKIYKFITENIVMRNISPNFIPLLIANQCKVKDIIDELASSNVDFARKEIFMEKLIFISSMFPKLKINFFMTATGSDMVSLEEFLTQLPDTEDGFSIFASILFQGIHALFVMDEYKIRQGDLHFRNILVEKLKNPVTLNYRIADKDVTFVTKFVLKMFDMDRAYNELVGDNPVNKAVVSYGNVNEFLQGRDFTQFLCGIMEFDFGKRILIEELEYIPEDVFDTIRSNSGDEMQIHLTEPEYSGIKIFLKGKKALEKYEDIAGVTYVFMTKEEVQTLLPKRATKIINHIAKKSSFKLSEILIGFYNNILYVLNSWNCLIAHRVENMNAQTFFQDDALFEKFKALLERASPRPVHPVLSYVYAPLPPTKTLGLYKPNPKDKFFDA